MNHSSVSGLSNFTFYQADRLIKHALANMRGISARRWQGSFLYQGFGKAQRGTELRRHSCILLGMISEHCMHWK